MSAPTRPALAGVTVLIAAAAAGCAAQPPLLTTPGPSSPPAPTASAAAPTSASPSAVRATPAAGLPGAATLTSPDPGVVALAALTVAYSADTGTDTGPLDAQRRALPWFGGGYAAALRAADDATAGPRAAWNSWSAHRAHLVVHVTTAADDHPADTPTTADRQYAVTQTPTAPGWTGPVVTVAVYVGLTRTPGGRWQVTELDQESP